MDRATCAIRRAERGDASPLRELLWASNRELTLAWPSWFYDGYLAELLDVVPRLEEAQVLVATDRSGMLGSVTWYPDARSEGRGWPEGWGGIRALAVHPRARGRGIGRLLALECLDIARRDGCTTIGLHTEDAMRAARKIYTALGFIRVPQYDVLGSVLFDQVPAGDDVLVKAYRFDMPSAR